MLKEPDVVRDDRIYLSTRIIAAIIIPILGLAFVILYFFPQLSGERFAFRVAPDVMGVYIGSGYLGGAYLFAHALFGRRWHRVSAGFPAVTTFTISMLLATVLHWEHFDIHHFAFQLWLVLYIVTPVLVPWMWLNNRATDPGTPEPDDLVVPMPIRWVSLASGIGLTAFSAVCFLFPQLLIAVWPWRLTLLSARLLAGWGALIGVGNLALVADARWSAWKVAGESIWLWHALFLIGAVFYQRDFTNGSLFNWYGVSVIAFLIASAVLYVYMEVMLARRVRSPQ